MRSATVRVLLKRYFGIEVGAHSYGPCLEPGAWPPGVTVGRYTSIGPDVAVFRRNHPTDRASTHPYFYNSHLGHVSEDTIEAAPLHIGSDVWIGARAIVTPGCRVIADGSVVAAGSVVTSDVTAYSVVGGVPARQLGTRFDAPIAERLAESRWWEQPPGALNVPEFQVSLASGETLGPLVSDR